MTSAKGEWRSQASWEFCAREKLSQVRQGLSPEVRKVIETAPELTKWPILDIDPIDTWNKGPLVLLGDACHAMTPYMASGAAMAIEDAAVLARCLVQEADHTAAFSLYQMSRMPRVDKVQQIPPKTASCACRLTRPGSWL